MKLNMGQWLSIPFIIIGVMGLYLSLKYKKRADIGVHP
jgi:prolipoprotein diacylglyceryltransferase